MAIRREMPSVRVDYIRVPGTEWVSDPKHRFDSIDMRGPMLLMVSRAFNAIADDLPRGFSLKSEMRNPTIGSIFHETQLAEAKGTGIGTMRRLMKNAGMMPPTFESDRSRNTFTIRILLHHFLSEKDLDWLSSVNIAADLSDEQKAAIIFLREVGAMII